MPAEPIQRVSSGGVHFDFAGLKANEMVQVNKWTGIKKRREFYRAILDEDPAAVLAAFSVVNWRETGTAPRWGEVDVDLDDLTTELVIDGRAVRVEFETDDSGDVILAVADALGRPIKDANEKTGYRQPSGGEDENVVAVPQRQPDGELLYRYKDNGELLPPTSASGTTPGSTDSPNTDAKPGATTDSASGEATTSTN